MQANQTLEADLDSVFADIPLPKPVTIAQETSTQNEEMADADIEAEDSGEASPVNGDAEKDTEMEEEEEEEEEEEQEEKEEEQKEEEEEQEEEQKEEEEEEEEEEEQEEQEPAEESDEKEDENTEEDEKEETENNQMETEDAQDGPENEESLVAIDRDSDESNSENDEKPEDGQAQNGSRPNQKRRNQKKMTEGEMKEMEKWSNWLEIMYMTIFAKDDADDLMNKDVDTSHKGRNWIEAHESYNAIETQIADVKEKINKLLPKMTAKHPWFKELHETLEKTTSINRVRYRKAGVTNAVSRGKLICTVGDPNPKEVVVKLSVRELLATYCKFLHLDDTVYSSINDFIEDRKCVFPDQGNLTIASLATGESNHFHNMMIQNCMTSYMAAENLLTMMQNELK